MRAKGLGLYPQTKPFNFAISLSLSWNSAERSLNLLKEKKIHLSEYDHLNIGVFFKNVYQDFYLRKSRIYSFVSFLEANPFQTRILVCSMKI